MIFCLLPISDLWDKVSLGAYFSSGWDLVVCAALISLHFDCHKARRPFFFSQTQVVS